MTPTADDVRRALTRHVAEEHPALPGRRNHLRAGVLVPLCWDPDPVAILTLRSPELARHAGEVSFPGGKPEPLDADLWATARREAREELGIDDARLLGRLSSMPLFTSDYRLEPYVAEVAPGPFRANPSEVSRVLRLRLADVLALPALRSVSYELDGARRSSPIFFFPDGVVMYGATAHTFHELISVCAPLFGLRVPPFEESELEWSDLL